MTELCFPLRRSSLLEFCKHLSEDEDRLVQMYTDTVYQEGKNYLDQEIFPQLTDVTGGEMLQKVIQFFGLDTWCGYRLTRVEYDAHANPPHMDLIFMGESMVRVEGTHTQDKMARLLLEKCCVENVNGIWKHILLCNHYLCYYPHRYDQSNLTLGTTQGTTPSQGNEMEQKEGACEDIVMGGSDE